jgi:hypothetical protein
MTEIKTLHQTLIEELGKRIFEGTEIPVAITSNLNPSFAIRPYQTRALQFFLNYWQESFDGKLRQNHQLLFHMATGSGKTLIMSGLTRPLHKRELLSISIAFCWVSDLEICGFPHADGVCTGMECLIVIKFFPTMTSLTSNRIIFWR